MDEWLAGWMGGWMDRWTVTIQPNQPVSKRKTGPEMEPSLYAKHKRTGPPATQNLTYF